MPKRDYSYGKIYKIISEDTTDIYIGSTVQTLSMRMTGHRRVYNYWVKNNKKYCSSCEILKYGNAEIKLITKYPCNSVKELRREEGRYQLKMDCVNRNSNIAGRTMKEYRQDNKKKIKENDKKYYQNNKIKISENKKKYHQDNKKKIKEYKKKYYQNNKIKIYENKKCCCGSNFLNTPSVIKKHFNTKKHQKFIMSFEHIPSHLRGEILDEFIF